MGNGCKCLNIWWAASLLVVSSLSVLSHISKNDFWDDSKTFIFLFLHSSKLQWGDDDTLHEDTEHILRLLVVITIWLIKSFYIPHNILDVWQTSVTSSPPKRSVLDCASSCQVSCHQEIILQYCHHVIHNVIGIMSSFLSCHHVIDGRRRGQQSV